MIFNAAFFVTTPWFLLAQAAMALGPRTSQKGGN
jgi:hypothetical protein